MMGTSSHASRVRAVLAPVLVVLHAGAGILVPVAHARAESRDGRRAVELQHSKTCTVIHVEARCSFAAFDHMFDATPRALHVEPRARVTHREIPPPPAFWRLPDLSTAPGRAPPHIHTA